MAIKQQSQTVNIALWIGSILTAALFLIAGGYKLAGGMDAQFLAWGYPDGFAVVVGVFEMIGGVCLLFKRTAGWSALGLMVIMLGAIWTHLAHGELLMSLLPVAVFVVLGLIVWGRGLALRTTAPLKPSTMGSSPHTTPS